ncbi:hypothetical protein HII36_18960 [Nonomuraea sp. NN258]|uniref:hypothetical protein n=1 Tax=Nonomuraea antri TaxID=2730852 RepID=UPI001569AC30|nr:hypothetical protein [Nonomuraea antri]NRQ33918.1 hypothetical protein [Nonomuraea antri]
MSLDSGRLHEARLDAQRAAVCLRVVRARLRGLAPSLPAGPTSNGAVFFGQDAEPVARWCWQGRWRCRIALLRSAEAHERAVRQHERRAEEDPAGAGEHLALAALHRRAAARDRKAASATAVYL